MNLFLINFKGHQLFSKTYFCHIILSGLLYEGGFYLSLNNALKLIIHIENK